MQVDRTVMSGGDDDSDILRDIMNEQPPASPSYGRSFLHYNGT